jgi:hypothetical protein
MKKYFWLIFGLFFISRFFFLSNYPHFYDSPEYYRESLSNNFFISLSQSHESIHPVYLFLTQLFQRIIPGQNAWEISLISAVFGLISFLAFYFLIKRNFGEKIAIFSLIPLIFFSHLWLIQINVLHESLDISLLLLALFFFDVFLTKKRFFYFLPALIFLALTLFDFIGILLWTPIFIGLTVLKSKKINWHDIFWSLTLIIFSLLLAISGLYFLSSIFRIKNFLFGYGEALLDWGFLSILRMLRNDGLVLFYGYSIAAILGLLITGIYLFKKKNWSVLIFFLSFFLPFLLTGKFWYGGLFGRYAILIAFPLALFLGLIPWRKVYGFLIIILFLTFLPTFWIYQKMPISQIQASLIAEINLRDKDLLILSDYQRPQLAYTNALYLGGDREQQKMIEEKIIKKLFEGDRVFISRQAINFPYWQYDGQQIHIISRGNKDKARLKEFLSNRQLTEIVSKESYPLLTIYQLSR